MNTEKVYVLKKDYENPSGKCHAGVSYTAKEWISRWFPKLTIEDFDIKDDWFSLKQPVENKRIEISKFCKFDTKDTKDSFYYQFCASKPLPKELSDQICIAIEYVVNDAFENIVPPTLERQEITPCSFSYASSGVQDSKASKEQDWEVVEFREGDYSFKRCSDSRFRCDKFNELGDNWGEDDLLYHKTKPYPIRSVRRKSDGAIFELHKVYYDEAGRALVPIKRFLVIDDVMYAQFDEGYGSNDGCLGINSLKVKPTPLFTTHDGKEVYEGDEYWWADKDSFDKEPHIAKSDHNPIGICMGKIFSTRSAAEDYVNKNKVVLVTEDGVGLKATDSCWRVFTKLTSYELYKPYWMFVTPDKAIDGEKYFSTEEKAKEWVLYNKPILSLKEIFSVTATYGFPVAQLEKEIEQLAKTRI